MKSKLIKAAVLLLVLAPAATATVDDVSINNGELKSSYGLGEEVTIEGSAVGQDLEEIIVRYRTPGDIAWDPYEINSQNCDGKACTIDADFSTDNPQTLEFQIRAKSDSDFGTSDSVIIEFKESGGSDTGGGGNGGTDDGGSDGDLDDVESVSITKKGELRSSYPVGRTITIEGKAEGQNLQEIVVRQRNRGELAWNPLSPDKDCRGRSTCKVQDSFTANKEVVKEFSVRAKSENDWKASDTVRIRFEDDEPTQPPTPPSDRAPNADMDVSPNPAKVGERITFDASGSSDPDNDIRSYRWSFGDGDTARGRTVTHSYSREGTFGARLVVEDSQGNTDRDSESVRVREADTGPVCSISDTFFLRLGETEIREGETTSARVNVHNSGDRQDVKVTFKADGQVIDRRTRTLSQGEDSSFSVSIGEEEDLNGDGFVDLKAELRTVGDPCGSEKVAEDDATLEIGQDRVDEEDATLRVEVEDEDGDEIEDARVRARNGEVETKRTDAEGEAILRLKPDSYTVEVDKSGFRDEERFVTLDSGENRHLKFTLEDRDDNDFEDEHRLRVEVEDEDGDRIGNARVRARNGDDEFERTDDDGEAEFFLEEDRYEVRVSKRGFETEEKDVDLDRDRTLRFRLEEDFDDDDDFDNADLDVRVRDSDGDDIDDALVRVENGDFKSERTGFDGEAEFNNLEPGDYEVEVSKNRFRTERRTIDLDDGERRVLLVTLFRRDRDRDRGEGLDIQNVQYPNSVCRGGSFQADVTVDNNGGFHEIVTITGSGLGSISAGDRFSLSEGQQKTRSVTFTNVRGSGTEQFDIRATNHVSDSVTRSIRVKDCSGVGDGDDGDTGGQASELFLELDPSRVRAGEAVKMSGTVRGVKGRSKVHITLQGKRVARTSTQPDGYFEAYIVPEQVGEFEVTASTDNARDSRNLRVLPTVTVLAATGPEKVFEGESFKVCADVETQTDAKILLLKDREVVQTKNGRGRVCFERTASDPGDHTFTVTALAHGDRNQASTRVEVLETGVETKNFPDKIASVESGSGLVKVELYNTHNELRRYDLSLEGMPGTWISQSEKQVVLAKGERETVYFYLTPEAEGEFTPDLKVRSDGAVIHQQKVTVSSGGTTKSKKTLLERLAQQIRL